MLTASYASANCTASFTVSNCTGRYVQVVVDNPDDEATYNWEFGTTEESDGPTAHYLYPQTGEQSVTLTVTVNGQTCSSTQSFALDNGDYTIIGDTDPSSAVDLTTIAGGLAATNYLILGTLNIDQSTSLTGKNFLMGAGASIVVDKDEVFQVFNSTFEGCAIMWNNIRSKNGAYIRLWNTDLNDADQGVKMGENSEIVLYDCDFNQNKQSVTLEFGGVADVATTISRCSFQGTISTLKPFYADQPKLSPYHPVGISTRNVSSVEVGIAGVNTSEYNFFDGLHTGIRSQLTNMTVISSTFQDSERGVHASGVGMLRVLGDGLPSTTMFTAMYQDAVYSTDGVNLEVKNARMSGVYRGVRHTKSPGFASLVENCNIQASLRGIASVDNANLGTGGIRILNNTITMSSTSAVESLGIELRQSTEVTPLNNEASVFQNTIVANNGTGGIDVVNLGGSVLIFNTITLGNTDLKYGIRLANADNTSIQKSNITGAGLTGTRNEAIIIESSANTDVFCNTTNNTRVGLRFSGACTESEIVASTFETHSIGLLYTGSAVVSKETKTGDQDGHGNAWTGSSYTSAAAIHEGENDVVEVSKYIVHQDANSGSIYWPSSILTPNATIDWFVFDPTAGLVSCNTSRTDTTSNGAQQIAQGHLNTGYFTVPVRWQAQQQLYKSLRADTSLAWQADPVLDSFYLVADQGSIGELTRIEEDMATYLTPSGALYAQRLHLDTTVFDYLTQKIVYDSIAYHGSGSTQTTHRNLSLQVALEVDSLFAIRVALQDSLDALQEQAALQIIQLNSSANSTDLHESNTLNVNDIYAQSILDDTISTTNIATLQHIAGQCPLLGGDAVYRARVMLEDTTYYDDQYICQQADVNYREAMIEEIEQVAVLTVFPNPTKSNLQVSLPTGAIQVDVALYDINGKVVLTDRIGSDDSIGVGHLARGVYICTLTDDLGNTATTKLILQ